MTKIKNDLATTFLERKKYQNDNEANEQCLHDMKKIDARSVKSINELNQFTESLRMEINKKVNTKTLDKVVESMAVFCTYEDLKDLYQKCIPALE